MSRLIVRDRARRLGGVKAIVGIGLFFVTLLLRASTISTVYYPAPESDSDLRGEYEVRLLRLALDKAGGHYLVKRATRRMQQRRAFLEIAREHGRLDVMASMTSKEREDLLLPIRIPLSRGLIGWRLALLKADRGADLRNIRTIDDLGALRAGQGHDWPDTDIMHANRLMVYGVSGYDRLFSMLAAGRFDYLPRSVSEIWPELAEHPDIAVDPYIAIHYPAADYFFVNRKNVALAEAIRSGLELAIADGSFNKLFYENFSSCIRQARLDQRIVIELANPFLSEATPLKRKALWFQLDDLSRVRPAERLATTTATRALP